jgi:SAM-dependent methyltransferase
MKQLFPYGLDAPPVVRNLALCALACWLLFALSFTHWSPITINGFEWPALTFSFGAAAMIWSSRYGKLRRREQLLDRVRWHGNERVLDIGCGRGLMAVAAARRAPRGQVTGIDIWQSEDLSGNGPEAVAANAEREGVAARVDTRTADMRELPFADATVDIVVSSTAIHNIYQAEGRDRAIDEIVRVLRPAGQVLIDDIRHLPQYAARLRAAGFEVILSRGMGSWFWRLLSLGNLAPGTLVGHKPPR